MHCTHTLQSKALYCTLIIALTFMAIEIAGGILANSLALYSDALHLLMDAGAILIALLVLKIAHLPRTLKMSYGYHRAEILGALANALSLWILCTFLIYEAIRRLLHPEPVKGPIVFIVAAVGLIANIIMIRRLHPAQGHSLNMRAVYLHVLGDLLGSIAVLVSGLILWLTHWNPIDALITLLFTLSILYSSWKVVSQCIKVLMESTPEGIDPQAVERDLQSLPSVTAVHDLHIWTVATSRLALSVHLIATDPQKALNAAHHILQAKHHIQHMTIQVEDPAHFQSQYCFDCDTAL